MASQNPLETLPLELFHRICQFLPRQSLFTLSLVSAACYKGTAAGRVARIRFIIRDEEKLWRDISHFENVVLGPDDLFRYVRRVTVIDEKHSSTPGASGDEDGDLTQNIPFNPSSPLQTPAQKQAQNKAWLPFAQFLARLTGLTDLVYSCTEQIPACVLSVLRQHHRSSRLHVSTFSLRSLYQPVPQAREGAPRIDPDEYALLTSPCLYSISTILESHDSEPRYSYNREAFREALGSGLMPRLRHLHVHFRRHYSLTAMANTMIRETPKARWQGFFGEQNPPGSSTPRIRLPLETLVITGSCDPEWRSPFVTCLHELESYLDLSTLRRYGHRCNHSTLSVPKMIKVLRMPGHTWFRSLRSLVIDPIHPAEAAALLRVLPPLEELVWLVKIRQEHLKLIFSRLGPTLRKLHLRLTSDDSLDSETILAMARSCPRLEDLQLRVLRSNGDSQEVALYRALGRMTRLKKLRLVLDCDMEKYTLVYESLKDNPPKQRAFQYFAACKVLRNLAVDGALAREIWVVITREMARAGPEHQIPVSPLENLAIEPRASCEWDTLRVLPMMGMWRSRRLICTRSWVEEVTVRTFENRYDEAEDFIDPEYIPRAEAVWRKVWPQAGKEWWKDWHSFPLSVEESNIEGTSAS
ncbi:hypothetical protein VTJ04DRAFT_8329 [Mycothermus thermophilus]|uniref:uncharacterized protein n=1 Tax=Humicola insolens TaxID=85995 RepID=UPI0037433804